MSLMVKWVLALKTVMFKLDYLKNYAKVATVTWFSKKSKLLNQQLLKAKDLWSLLKTRQSLNLCFWWVVMVRSPSQELNTTWELGDSHTTRKGQSAQSVLYSRTILRFKGSWKQVQLLCFRSGGPTHQSVGHYQTKCVKKCSRSKKRFLSKSSIKSSRIPDQHQLWDLFPTKFYPDQWSLAIFKRLPWYPGSTQRDILSP
jgi:hypothetical protein